jgi:hypothetical protein
VLPQYDEAMRRFVSVKMNGTVVPLVGPVTPDRAFAYMRNLMKESGQIITDDRFVPLPFMSFYRMQHTPNQSRFSRADVRKTHYSDDDNITGVARRPFPYDIPYQIDVWCRFEDDFNYIIEALDRKWYGLPHAYVDVDHGDVWGVHSIAVTWDGAQDTSDLESDDGDRILRYTLSCTAEGFMTFRPKKVKTVRDIQIRVSTNATPHTKPESFDDSLIFEHKD